MSEIDAIRARHAAARPGPWRWWGSLDGKDLHLVSLAPGRWTVMKCDRHGMRGAQPTFCNHDTGLLEKGSQIAIFQVCPECTDPTDPRVYRNNVIGYRNPDAELIAHSWEDIATLLARIDELEAMVTG